MRYRSSIIFISLMLIGCSNSNYYKSEKYNTYEDTRSKAMNIILAGEITTRSKKIVQDVPYENVEKALREAGYGKDVEIVAGTGLAAAKLSGNMIATPGISDSLGGSIMLLHTLTKSTYVAERTNGMVAWMPFELAKDSKEAHSLMVKILTDAVLSSLPDDITYTTEKRVHNHAFGETAYNAIILKGGICDRDDNTECRLIINTKEPLTDRPAPVWINENDVYFWSSAPKTPYAFPYIGTATIGNPSEAGYKLYKKFMNDEFLSNVSVNLPDWYFIYSPNNLDRAFPVVFNQGKAHLFIQPKPQEAR